MATADGNRSRTERDPAYETRHETGGEASLSETIIDAVATAEDVDPTSCDLGLYEAVDLEALDTLFDRRSADDHWRFEFAIDEFLVTVTGDGRVTVCETR
ncbi:HalOD1 output domain-containing protein [Halorussus caseinilyticus]|uniref:HalOD1 output domain-containing protein n=1 Tax=Halorussus caseinilyticus TaxID=3034025 RepID=A0ABD5WMI5_9EURY|nr:HalOD1 output domain-containing protein [Halorussus sp. DT72]